MNNAMKTKVCKKCGLEKSVDDFYIQKLSKDGYRTMCKLCFNEYNEKYKKEFEERNINYYKKYNKKYNLNNKEYHKEYNKKRYLKNLEKEKEKNKLKNKKYYNPEYYKKYRNNNKEKINKTINKRIKNNPLFKLKKRIRTSITNSFKSKDFLKPNRTTEILGCTIEQFKIYLESKFESWMTWDNKGLYNGQLNFGWDIDHIIPLCSAKTESELIKLNHYTNLQPLCSKVNRDMKKGKGD